MSNELHFIENAFLWQALAIALLLVLVFMWSAWKGVFNARFYVHSAVGVLAVLALVLLYLRPAWSTRVSGSAVLLTQGYDAMQLDSIKKQKKGIRVINYAAGMHLSAALDSINELTILGQGLRDFDLWQLEGTPANYIGGTLPKGVVELSYPKAHRVGKEWSVRGLYHQPIIGNSLVLQSASGKGLDSIVFEAETARVFGLKTNPKAAGKFLYQLVEKDSVGVILNADPVPVTILEKQALRIFISNQFPSFETKYLKNFLAEEGHELVVRSKITKNKYKFEYFNTDANPVYGFPKKSLAQFDLLILDVDSFLSSSKAERETLLNLIKEQGIGLFVQPNAALFKTDNTMLDFGAVPDGADKMSLLEMPKLVLEKYPYAFKDGYSRGVAIENHSYSVVLGKGRLSTSLLHTTYQLVLDGNKDAYQNIWTKIIEATARQQETTTNFKANETFVFVNMPYTFTVQTELGQPIIKLKDSTALPLLKDAVLKDAWHGKTYPSETGWQTLKDLNDTTVVFNYFVMDSLRWKPLVGAKTILENRRFFTAIDKMQGDKKQIIEASRWWFFLVFLCGMGYLWLVPKLKG